MFLYLGGNTNILSEKIISIHDYSEFKKGKNYSLIEKAKMEKRLILLADENKIKTVVITESKIFLSCVSVLTLRKRAVKGYYL